VKNTQKSLCVASLNRRTNLLCIVPFSFGHLMYLNDHFFSPIVTM
jgi:hypothetical protein